MVQLSSLLGKWNNSAPPGKSFRGGGGGVTVLLSLCSAQAKVVTLGLGRVTQTSLKSFILREDSKRVASCKKQLHREYMQSLYRVSGGRAFWGGLGLVNSAA